jgi:hypothetical protein
MPGSRGGRRPCRASINSVHRVPVWATSAASTAGSMPASLAYSALNDAPIVSLLRCHARWTDGRAPVTTSDITSTTDENRISRSYGCTAVRRNSASISAAENARSVMIRSIKVGVLSWANAS